MGDSMNAMQQRLRELRARRQKLRETNLADAMVSMGQAEPETDTLVDGREVYSEDEVDREIAELEKLLGGGPRPADPPTDEDDSDGSLEIPTVSAFDEYRTQIIAAALVLALIGGMWVFGKQQPDAASSTAPSAIPTTTSLAATATARATGTIPAGQAPLTLRAERGSYVGEGCAYTVRFAWVIDGYNGEQVTIHFRDLDGSDDQTDRFGFATKPEPTAAPNSQLVLGGAYLADTHELVYLKGGRGSTPGYTAEITFIGNHPLQGERTSIAPARGC